MEPDPVLSVAGLTSIGTGFLAYQNSSLSMAIFVALMVLGTAFLVLKAGIMGAMAAMTNPFVSFFVAFPIAFAYFTIQGGVLWPVAAKSLGAGFLAGAVSMTVFNYWNIH